LRFASGNSEAKGKTQKQHTNGARAQTKHPPNRFAMGRSGLSTASLSKKRANKLGITAFQANMMKALACEFILA